MPDGQRTARGASPWPSDVVSLDAEQRRLARLDVPAWQPPSEPAIGPLIAGCFLAFARGQQGPGHAGDRGWVAGVVIDLASGRTAGTACLPCVAGARYEAGRLALREGPALQAAIEALPVRPDVVMVDATGRDHPRRAGLALHLGAVLDLPSLGVTHRPLVARGEPPGPEPGRTAPLVLDGEVVAAWLRTATGVRPVVVHPGWRTDLSTAVRLTWAGVGVARTPEPLRRARVLARTTRAHAEGRTAQAWRDPLATLPVAPLHHG